MPLLTAHPGMTHRPQQPMGDKGQAVMQYLNDVASGRIAEQGLGQYGDAVRAGMAGDYGAFGGLLGDAMGGGFAANGLLAGGIGAITKKQFDDFVSEIEGNVMNPRVKVRTKGSPYSDSRYAEFISPDGTEIVDVRFANHPQSGHAITLHGPPDIQVGDFKYSDYSDINEDLKMEILERLGLMERN